MARRHKDVSVQVEGLDEVQKRLRRLPERNQRHVMRPAVRRAGTVVAKVARRLAPKGTGLKPSGAPRTPLRKTIKSTSVKWYRKTNTFAVVLGPEKNKAPHSHLVHDGTQPHEIVLTQPLVLGNTVLPAGFVIPHPGAKANPFMDRAAEASRGQTIAKLRTEILAGIEKQVRKLANEK